MNSLDQKFDRYIAQLQAWIDTLWAEASLHNNLSELANPAVTEILSALPEGSTNSNVSNNSNDLTSNVSNVSNFAPEPSSTSNNANEMNALLSPHSINQPTSISSICLLKLKYTVTDEHAQEKARYRQEPVLIIFASDSLHHPMTCLLYTSPSPRD